MTEIKLPITEHPDELSFVDKDIRKIFESHQGEYVKTYFIGHPTVMQLCKELRLLREALKK